MRAQRIDLIEDYIEKNKTVSLDNLCEAFDVSKNTIRRDIDALVKRGRVRKVYGGVTFEESQPKTAAPFEERNIRLAAEKERICRKAADYIENGDIIYIDTGTTCISLVDCIHDKTCTILTNSLQIATKAVPYPNLNIIMLPGRLMRNTLSFVGAELTEQLKTYNISKAFMACTGVSITNGLTNASTEEHLIKKAIVENSQLHYLLADHSKFGTFTLMTYSTLDQMDYIITDQPPEEDYQNYCRDHGIALHLA